MKITRGTPKANTPPYNDIFNAFGDFLTTVLDGRLEVDLDNTYVQMPGPQKEISDFALSPNKSIGLLVGSIGIGKTSVLTYIHEKMWSQLGCKVFPLDFSVKSENVNLGEEFYELDDSSQRQRALLLAEDKIKQLIKRKIGSWVQEDIKKDPQSIYEFFEQYFPEYVPDEALLFPNKPHEMLQLIQKNYGSQFLTTCFYYYIHTHDIRHIKFVYDNLDDKEILLTRAVIELSAHLVQGVKNFNEKERELDPQLPSRWMTCIAACRPDTAEAIQYGDDRSGKDWYAYREIQIVEPCSLSEAIIKRYRKFHNLNGESDTDQAEVAFSLGNSFLGEKRWTIKNRDTFFEKIFNAFTLSGQSAQVVELCNYNVASSMKSVLEVLRNQHFFKDEDLLVTAMSKTKSEFKKSATDTFTGTTVIRSLAYGNQGNTKPVYPILHTPVVNLLHSKHLDYGRSTFKPRVISMFMNNIVENSPFKSQISLECLINLGVQYLGISFDTAEAVIDEMYEQGLIVNVRLMKKPSVVGMDCPLSLTPRAALLWRLLSEDSILLQCYRDDSELDESLEWKGKKANFINRPTLEMPIEEVGRELMWMVRQFWLREEEEINSLADSSRYHEFRSICGTETITERLLHGLENSRKRFYNQYGNLEKNIESQFLESANSELSNIIDKKKKEWRDTDSDD